MGEHANAGSIHFTVNGKKCTVNQSTPRTTSLNAYLRYVLHLPGTKAMCHEGGCGTCIVSVTAPHPVTKELKTFSVNSCLVLVFSCHGWDITTIEGVGNRRDGYDPIQKRMCKYNATQCGYCTPGWVMQMHSLLAKKLTQAEIERSFASNTCRCTGYRPILDTMKSFAIDANITDIEDINDCQKRCKRKCSIKSVDSDWCMLEDSAKSATQIKLSFGKRKFYKVFSVDEIFNILNIIGISSYALVAGNTGKALYETYEYPDILIDINDVATLKQYTFDQNLILGANMTLEEAKKCFEETGREREFGYLLEFAKHLELVAHLPVRNIGTLAGNLVMKHKLPNFQSDIYLLLEAVGAMVTIESLNGWKATITMKEFIQTDLTNMLLVNILLPPSSEHIVRTYKIMPRSQNALAIVNAAFIIKFNTITDVIDEAILCFGNIAPNFTHAYATESYLIGKRMNDDVLYEAMKILESEIQPIDDPPEDSPETRKKLAIGLFYKFILNICPKSFLNSRYLSGGELIERPVSNGTQVFHTDPSIYPLNEPVPKLEALIQSSGEAEYVNDIPNLPRQVFGAFVLSDVYSGEIDVINCDCVLSISGVQAVLTAKDIPGINTFIRPNIQLQVENEELLASTDIKYHGQPVAIVVAETEALAAEVAKKVEVKYKNVKATSPVLTIDEARKDKSRIQAGPTRESKGRGVNITKVIKGVYEIEAQYHYYTEPMTAVVVPRDNGLEVYSATQWLDLTQIAIADCLNIKESDILVKVSRLGGGFGGKLSRASQVSTACALVAYKMNVPCRFILPLQTNMIIAGRRLPCKCEYEVGVNDNGRIQYLNATILEDNGCSRNESILSYTLEGFSHCYNTDFWSVKSFDVYTDLPSNTFFRAPGTLEGISCIEHIMEHIAFEMEKDPTDVRYVNMRPNDNDLPILIPMFKKQTEFDKRVKEIQEFNEQNRWMKKALTLNVMLFPVIYYGNYHALVSIYRGDGTVTVTTGGVEMGQGVNTKAAQVCAKALKIPLDLISVLPNYSFTAANNVFSGSSIVSESICFAIIKACEILQRRLQPIRDTMKGATWNEIVKKAGDDQIDLVASYMMNDMEPELQDYSAFAVNVLELQLDVLIGRYEILRLDILEDVGVSTNPAIDVGQVEGGLIQGLGYYTSEKLKFDEHSGRLLTNRSLNYHVPLALDIPADFRVYFRYNSKNPNGVLNSKAVGEMGVCTAHSITHALRKCINESRHESGYDREWINIDIPYTTESILEALHVNLEEFRINT